MRETERDGERRRETERLTKRVTASARHKLLVAVSVERYSATPSRCTAPRNLITVVVLDGQELPFIPPLRAQRAELVEPLEGPGRPAFDLVTQPVLECDQKRRYARAGLGEQ